MRKSVIVFFIFWFLLLLLVVTTEVWCFYHPLHSLHNDLRCLAAAFHEMAQTEKLQYWVCGGTLLGSVRHGDIIKHDDDIDLVIKIQDLAKLQSLAPQYHLNCTPNLWSGVWKITQEGLRGCLDIFLVQKQNQQYVLMDMAKTWWPHEAFDVDDTFTTPYPLGKYTTQTNPKQFVDLVLMGPDRASNTAYFERSYGASWFTPRVNFVHTLVGVRETFWYSVFIVLLAMGLLGAQVAQIPSVKK